LTPRSTGTLCGFRARGRPGPIIVASDAPGVRRRRARPPSPRGAGHPSHRPPA